MANIVGKVCVVGGAICMMVMSYSHMNHSNLFFSTATALTCLAVLLIVPKSVKNLFSSEYSYKDLDVTRYISDQIYSIELQTETRAEYDSLFDKIVIVVLTLSTFGFTYLKLFRHDDIQTFSVGKIIALLSGALTLVAKVQSIVLTCVLKLIVDAKRKAIENQWRTNGFELQNRC
jgi:hypothetical protein